MYTFIKKEESFGIPFACFVAKDRSVWEVAMYYQLGYIKREFITTRGKWLSIRVVNNDYTLRSNSKYHLLFSKGKEHGYMTLKIPFEEGSYVADMYRLDLKENSILPSTWLELFNNKSEPFALPDMSSDFSDYTDDEFHTKTPKYSEEKFIDEYYDDYYDDFLDYEEDISYITDYQEPVRRQKKIEIE